jgi:hypothetical protein
MVAIGEHTIVRLDKRDEISEQILFEIGAMLLRPDRGG